MKLKNTALALICLAGPAICVGQSAPLLQLSIGLGPDGGEGLIAHNIYSSPAEEYVVVDYSHNSTITACAPKFRDVRKQCVVPITIAQKLPHPPPASGDPDPLAIAPGASRELVGLSSPKSLISFTDVAVIYADGTMGGEPSVLNQMLFERRKNLQDAQQDLVLLERIEVAPHPNWAKLERRFKRRANMHDKQLGWAGPGGAGSAPLYGPAHDLLCRNAAKVFSRAAASHRPPGPLPYLERYLKWAIQELQGPPLDATNGN